jgi:hypothetical protein
MSHTAAASTPVPHAGAAAPSSGSTAKVGFLLAPLDDGRWT